MYLLMTKLNSSGSFSISTQKGIRIHEVFETASVVLYATLSILAMTHVVSTIIFEKQQSKSCSKSFFA